MSRRGWFVALGVLLAVPLASSVPVSAQTIGGRVLDRATKHAAFPVSVRVLDDSGRVLTTATTDSAGIFYANLIAPAHVRVRFDLDRLRWVVTDTLTIGAGEFVQREFLVPFIETFFEFQVEKMVSQRGGFWHLRYPVKLRNQQVEGEVLAQFVVDTTGEAILDTFHVLRTTHLEFADAVRAGLPAMRFNPAEIGGRRVKQLVQQPFTFSLRQDSSASWQTPGAVPFPDLPRAGRHNP